jgi:anaerobic magnesium-protoporphyrin IX monomethyl ester cyclase
MHLILINPRAQVSHRRLPLSLLFLARGIPDDFTWEIVDGNMQKDARQRAWAAVDRDPSDCMVLMTVMPGPQLRWALPWLRQLRARHPSVPVIWGGYFPTVHPEVTAEDPDVDVVVLGQGEETLTELLPRLRDDGVAGAAGIPGTVISLDGELIRGPTRPAQISSRLGPIDESRLDVERYAARTFLGNRTYSHHSSVGCPYVCDFCAVTTAFRGRWLADPADAVIERVRTLHSRYGADGIEFHDNNFFAAEARVRQVAEGMEGLGIRWWGEGRIDTMLGWSDTTWRTMARSGLSMVFYGAESADQDTLDAMNKGGLRVDDTLELNHLAASHGVIPEFSFVMGNPSDPDGDIDRTLALARRLKDENPSCEIILYLYSPVPMPDADGQVPRAPGFSFPETLDEWISPAWSSFDQRRNPGTPWLTRRMVKKVHDFESVLHAHWPSVSDRNLSGIQRNILRALSAPRIKLGRYDHPWELKLLQKLWHYRRPEEMGF